MKSRHFMLLLMLAIFATTAVVGQAVYGRVFGTVTDQSGAAVAGAKITITDADKGISTSTTTNAAGNYNVTHLTPGNYNVQVEMEGFKTRTAERIRVFADQAARVDAQLDVGATTETVTVTAEDIPLLKTDRADVATTFTEREVTELPIIGRNFTDFQLLTPGTQLLTWSHAASENPQQSKQIFVNGQHFSGSAYQLDGTDNRDPILGIIVVNSNLESVTETKIATQNYDAEFGQALAAVITAQTKSGTNELHGSAFWFRRDDELRAKDPFVNIGDDAKLAHSQWSQFGGSLGGPIIKNKWFIFGDYQGQRFGVGRSVIVGVPTQLVRDTCLNPGSLTCNLSEYVGQAGVGDIYDPTTGNPDGSGRTAFPGGIIPNALISDQARALLNLLPGPNTAGTDGGTRNNYAASGTGGHDSDSFDIRSDYQLGDNVHIFGRYSWYDFTLSGRGVFDTDSVAVGGLGLGLDGFAGISAYTNHSLATGFDWAVSPNWLMDFRLGWFKYGGNVNPNGLGTTPAADVGIPGLNLTEVSSGMPAIFIGDQGQVGGDIALGYALSQERLNRCNCPLVQDEDGFQFVNNWTNIRGNHQIKFGADIRFARNLRIPSDRHRSGEISFSKTRTGVLGDSTAGLGLATFLLGDVTRFTRYPPEAPTDAAERQHRRFFYAQDTWRATPKLTLNFGLRWELYYPETVTGDARGGHLDLETGRIRVAGVGGIERNMDVEMNYTNFAPRLGVAYQITDKTILRMGYGRSFDVGVFGSIFGHAVTQNLPVLPIQENLPSSVGQDNTFGRVFELSSGPSASPVVDVPSDGLIPLPDTIFQRSRPNKMRLPTVDAWNITIQHQLTPTLSAEVAYVGNKGTHVFAGDGPAFNVNQATLEGFGTVPFTLRLPFFNRFDFQSADAAGNCTSFDPVTTLPLCWTQGIDYFGNLADNNYHALQFKLEKRFSSGWSMLGHYTWAQGFNEDGSYFPIDDSVSYGPNNFVRRHVLVLTNLWELPFGRGKQYGGDVSTAVDYIIGGWQINTITNWSGGLPFTPGLSSCGGISDTGPCRPNILINVGEIEYGDRNNWFPVNDPSIWGVPAAGTFGNAKRNSLRGPQFFNTDLSIFKNFRVTERVQGQFRTEIFNVFNRLNLGTPGVFFTEFGFGGTNCVNCGSPTRIERAGGPMRQAQFALRFTF